MLGDSLVHVISPESDEGFFSNTHLPITVYGEGDKLYRLINDQWYLLYDFSLSVGDTFELFIAPINRDNRIPDKFSYLVVDSVGQLSTDAGVIKTQFLRTLEEGQFAAGSVMTGWQYQYIGNVFSYFTPFFELGCDRGGCPYFFRCYHDDVIGEIKVVDFPYDTVIRVGTTDLPDVSQELSLYPNPVKAGDNLLVQWSDRASLLNAQVGLMDATGKIVSVPVVSVPNGYQLKTGGLPPGLYFLSLASTEARALKKIVIH